MDKKESTDYRSNSKLWKAPGAERYEKLNQVGEGTYGKVFKARDKDGKYVALKCILMDHEKEGFPITALRELMILKNLKHPNVVDLKEIVSTKTSDKWGNVYLVFEYLNHDLSGLLKQKHEFSAATLKSIFYQCLLGLDHLHKNGIIHRDIKAANVLISGQGEIKIGDFGLARKINPNIPTEKNRFTTNVVTLWYRAPEILLGAKNYTFNSDIWSLGTMFLEILLGRHPFIGQNESIQITKIFEICGTPIIDLNDEYALQNPNNIYWPELKYLENYSLIRPNRFYSNAYDASFKEILKYDFFNFYFNLFFRITPNCYDLIKKMLSLNPSNRISAEEALQHEYFKEEPQMNNDDFLSLSDQETHDFVIKRHTLDNNQGYQNNLQNNNEGNYNQYGVKLEYENNHSFQKKSQSFLGNKKDKENN